MFGMHGRRAAWAIAGRSSPVAAASGAGGRSRCIGNSAVRKATGGGRRRMFDGGELRLVLLKLIQDEPRHGYDLIKEIEELTGGAYAPSPGVVYPTLSMLADRA